MEADDEVYGVTGSSYTAKFWQYDSRLGRRWNIDPVTYPWQSTYACFNNNPITFVDPLGLYSVKGKLTKQEKQDIKKEHGSVLFNKEARKARKSKIREKEDKIRSYVAEAKNIIDNNEDAKKTFIDFSGIEEGSEEWENMWTENGRGPTLIADDENEPIGENIVKNDMDGQPNPFTMKIKFKTSNINSNYFGGVLYLHESVEMYDVFRGTDRIHGSSNPVNGYTFEQMKSGLQDFRNIYLNNSKTLLEIDKVYKGFMDNGKITKIELGFAFEKVGLGGVKRNQ